MTTPVPVAPDSFGALRPRLDSRALAMFVAVAETLSFRQAAELLHMTQPPLSRAIRSLEDRLGARLFERDTRAVALTAAGRVLLPRARRILADVNAAEAAVAALRAAPVSRLKVGLTSAVEPAWFRTLPRLLESQPGIRRVDIETAASPTLVRRLRTRRLDAAFIALPTETEGLVVTPIETQPLIVAAAADAFAGRRVVSLSDLADRPLFWFERRRQPAFFDHCRRVFNRHGFAPRTLPEPVDQHVLLAAVAAGRGVAFLPSSFRALKRDGVRYLALREGTDMSVGIGLAVSPGAEQLAARLLAVVASERRPRVSRDGTPHGLRG
jgi:DNA-binding transcriptional LysR family regulator